MKAQITLKSGAQITVDVTRIKTGRNPMTNSLTSMEWDTPANWTAKLHTVDVDEIVAIVILEDEPTTVARVPGADVIASARVEPAST